MSSRTMSAAKRARDLRQREDARFAARNAKQRRDYSVYEGWARALRECEQGHWFITGAKAERIFGERLTEAQARGLLREMPGYMFRVAKPHLVLLEAAA